MATCTCSNTHVSVNCVLQALDKWMPPCFVACMYCYAGIPLEDADEEHACTNRSADDVRKEILDTLAFFDTYHSVYNILVAMHPEQAITVEHFIRTYIGMIANDNDVQAIYDVLWTKDYQHGALLSREGSGLRNETQRL